MGSVDMLELFLSEFEGLCRIPRPSGGEREICGYLARRLTEMGYSPVRDEHYNLFCDIPPTKGIPETPPLAMQAHTDMVCVGAEDYMPERDPILRRRCGGDPCDPAQRDAPRCAAADFHGQ